MEEEGEILLLTCSRSESGVTVTLSDGEVLELAAESLPPAMPAAGERVSPAVLAELREAAARKEIARRVFRMLDRRLRTRADMRRKLIAAGYAAGPIDSVLDRFATEGLVSDRRFAEAWCRDTLMARPVGRRYLESRLIAKGVAPQTAREVAAAELDVETERELAHAAAARWWRRRSAGGEVGFEQIAKAARYLAGRGFPPALAREAAGAEAPQGGERR